MAAIGIVMATIAGRHLQVGIANTLVSGNIARKDRFLPSLVALRMSNDTRRCIDRALDINDNFGMASNVLAGARPARLAAQEMAGIQISCTT